MIVPLDIQDYHIWRGDKLRHHNDEMKFQYINLSLNQFIIKLIFVIFVPATV